jgi:hypothetical protein
MKAFSWKATLLSAIAIAMSVGIFLMLLSYLRDMISLTAGVRAFGNLALILGLGLAELAFIFLIGAHLNTCAAKSKLLACFLSTATILAAVYSLAFLLRYMLLIRILGENLSIETIKAVPTQDPVLFLISMSTVSVCISIRLFQHTNRG